MTHNNSEIEKKIGFWKINFKPNENLMPWDQKWPMPIENSATIDQSHYINKIKNLEKHAACNVYRGPSICRICGISNGCREYTSHHFCWPSGYLHYLEDHNVAIDPDFQLLLDKIE